MAKRCLVKAEERINTGTVYHVIDRDGNRKELKRWRYNTEEEATAKYYSLQEIGHIRELEMIKESRYYTLKEERINRNMV